MDFRHLKTIGLDIKAPQGPLDQPAAAGSRWSPEMLKEQLEKLPVTRNGLKQKPIFHPNGASKCTEEHRFGLLLTILKLFCR